MKEIKISQGRFAQVDAADYEYLSKYKWHYEKGYVSRNVPAEKGQVQIYMHTQVMGGKRSGLEIDHVNGDGLDNRRQNLRYCTHSENMKNRKMARNNTSGYKGVSYAKTSGKWMAYICVNSKLQNLGYYDTAEKAAEVYDEAARKNYGDFARINSSL
jgi:hypothetical protein